MMDNQDEYKKRELDRQRYELLRRLDAWLDWPMVVLAFIWLALLIYDWTWGPNSASTTLGIVIWIIFILDFVIEFVLAPKKGKYLRTNWLTAISLVVPALRILQIARALRVVQITRVSRGSQLLRFLGSINRGMRVLGHVMSRRGLGYVVLLTLIVTFTGAAGMYAFEKNDNAREGFDSYGTSLWWTAMIMTTMGSQYWPVTPEGRILCFFLALYAFTVFGYVTAVLASFFIGVDRAREQKKDDMTK